MFVHSEVEYALRAGPSVIRATADLVNISTPGRTAIHSGEAFDITTPQMDVWTTNITTEALENIRMFTSNLTMEACLHHPSPLSHAKSLECLARSW